MSGASYGNRRSYTDLLGTPGSHARLPQIARPGKPFECVPPLTNLRSLTAPRPRPRPAGRASSSRDWPRRPTTGIGDKGKEMSHLAECGSAGVASQSALSDDRFDGIRANR